MRRTKHSKRAETDAEAVLGALASSLPWQPSEYGDGVVAWVRRHYCHVRPVTRWWFFPAYTARRFMAPRSGGEHRPRKKLYGTEAPRYLFASQQEARAACERHHATGWWREKPKAEQREDALLSAQNAVLCWELQDRYDYTADTEPFAHYRVYRKRRGLRLVYIAWYHNLPCSIIAKDAPFTFKRRIDAKRACEHHHATGHWELLR